MVLSQNGRVLYQTNVAPGPFVIQDISEAVQGNIDVRVEEEDGRVTVFQVNAASVPFLTRKGAVRYKAALGRPMLGNSASNPTFFSGEFSWGAFNHVSLYGGLMTTSQDYTSAALGIGQNYMTSAHCLLISPIPVRSYQMKNSRTGKAIALIIPNVLSRLTARLALPDTVSRRRIL